MVGASAASMASPSRPVTIMVLAYFESSPHVKASSRGSASVMTDLQSFGVTTFAAVAGPEAAMAGALRLR